MTVIFRLTRHASIHVITQNQIFVKCLAQHHVLNGARLTGQSACHKGGCQTFP